MFDLKKLESVLEKDIEIHTTNLDSDKGNHISFYHKKSGFYYKVNILLKDDFIFLDFHEIYNKKDFNHERRVEMSMIAHSLKRIIQDTSKHRVRLLSGVSKISWDWLIIENVEEYLKRNKREFVYNLKSEIVNLFEKSIIKAKEDNEEKEYKYDFYICGEDGFYLFELLDELGIAKLEEKRKVDLKLEFLPNYLSKKKVFIEEITEGLKELGFQVQLFNKKKSG